MNFPNRLYPSIASLRALEAFGRHGTVTATAHELALTQSAVSRQLQTLEEQLGTTLFRREQKRLTLTSAGIGYVQEIRTALSTILNASLRLKANPSGGGLNLAILPAFGVRWLAPRLTDFTTKHPEVTVNLGTRLLPFDFDREHFHAAIHFGMPDWPHAGHLELFTETVVPVGAPALIERARASSIQDLLQLPLLHLETRPHAWQKWMALNGAQANTLTGPLFDQFATMIQAAIHGLGIALAPSYLVEQELVDGRLQPAIDIAPVSLGKYYLVWPSDQPDYGPTQAFRNWIEGAR